MSDARRRRCACDDGNLPEVSVGEAELFADLVAARWTIEDETQKRRQECRRCDRHGNRRLPYPSGGTAFVRCDHLMVPA